MIEFERLPKNVTQNDLCRFATILETDVWFKWPWISDYYKPLLKRETQKRPKKRRKKENDVNVSAFSNLVFEGSCVQNVALLRPKSKRPNFHFGKVFKMPIRLCVFENSELRSLEEYVKSDSFACGNLKKIEVMMERDDFCKKVIATVLNESEEQLSVSVIEELVLRMLNITNFFNFEYEDNIEAIPHVKTILTLDTLLLVVNERSVGDEKYYLAAYALANRYLEIYYVTPIERWLSGTYFQYIKQLAIRPSLTEEYDFWDERILTCLDVPKTKKKKNEEIMSKNVEELETKDHENEKKRRLREDETPKKNPLSNGFSKMFEINFSDPSLMSVLQRNLIDCPEGYVKSHHKKQIMSALNINAILKTMIIEDPTKDFFLNLHHDTEKRVFDLGLLMRRYLTTCGPLSNGFDLLYIFNHVTALPSLSTKTIEEPKKPIVLVSNPYADHIFLLCSFRWHCDTYECISERNQLAVDEIIEKRRKTRILICDVEREPYLESFNDFLASQQNIFIYPRVKNEKNQVLQVKRSSKTFIKFKRFAGLTEKEGKLTVVVV